jgi:hypothetical protein
MTGFWQGLAGPVMTKYAGFAVVLPSPKALCHNRFRKISGF